MPNKISAKTCELFNIPFFQFAQMKKYCPETIPTTKADYKREWNHWKETILQVSQCLAFPFAPPHIEKQALAEHNLVEFIAKTIQSLQPLYERCHR